MTRQAIRKRWRQASAWVLRVWTSGLWLGLIAQGASFGASMMPVVFGGASALVGVIMVTAPASLLLPVYTLSAASRIPAARGKVEARWQLRLSLGALAVCAVGLASVSLVVLGAERWLQSLWPLGALLSLSMGLYSVAYGLSVRTGLYRSMMKLRFVYGTTVFVGSLFVCLFVLTGPMLLVASSMAFLTASVSVFVERPWIVDDEMTAAVEADFSKPTFRGLMALSLSQAAGNLFAQAGALGVHLLGTAAPMWSVVVRTVSGLQTIGDQLVAPRIDMVTARAVRGPNGGIDKSRSGTSAVKVTILWTLISAAGVAAALLWTNYIARDGEVFYSVSFFILIIGYSITGAGLSPVARILVIQGRVRDRAAWDGFRMLMAALLLLRADSQVFMIGLGLGGIVSFVWYLLLLRKGVRHQR